MKKDYDCYLFDLLNFYLCWPASYIVQNTEERRFTRVRFLLVRNAYRLYGCRLRENDKQ